MSEPNPARVAFVDTHVPGWLAGRRYGVPEPMVAGATGRRLAGDWRGACAAARVDIAVDPQDIADRYGTEVAARLAEDLRHLVPDLVRWHLPRQVRGGSGLLSPSEFVPLARYAGDLALYVATPPHLERPQRLVLHCGQPPGETDRLDDWTDARYLWDDRATHLLLAQVGGGDRTPFFHRDGRPRAAGGPAEGDPVALVERIVALQDEGQIEQAWAEGGVPADFTLPAQRYPVGPDWTYPAAAAAVVPALAPVAHRLLSRPGAPEMVVLPAMYAWGPNAVGLRLVDGRLHAGRVDRYQARHLPPLPRPAWQRFPDVELLRTGVVGSAEVHPLVRAALFPDEPDPGFRHRLPQPQAATVRVRCRGEWHDIGWQGGRVTALRHSAEEARRERVMRSLGGAVPGCFTVTETWQGSVSGRLPRALRQLRTHAIAAIVHGRADTFGQLLDSGIDPTGVLDRWHRGPLHHLAKMDDERLLARLLGAGMDINARDAKGRTPLAEVLFDGGPATLVRAMLDAGADPTATDGYQSSTLHLLRSADAARIVPWLTAAGVDPNGYDMYGRPPLMAQIRCAAPAEVMRATLLAGADPGATDEYTEEGIVSLVGEMNRDDLGFLVEAAGAADGGER